jgi:hypothetical protein
MDIQKEAVESAIVHWPLVIAFVGILWAFGKWALPKSLAKFFTNGGGILIGNIVDRKLVEQDTRSHIKMQEAFREHEELEDKKLALALKVATADAHIESAKIVGRLERIEEHLWRKD